MVSEWDKFERSITSYETSLSNAINRYRNKDLIKLRNIDKSYQEVRDTLVALWNDIDNRKGKIKDANSFKNNINSHINTIDTMAKDLHEVIKSMTGPTPAEPGGKPKEPTPPSAELELREETLKDKSPEELKKIEDELLKKGKELRKKGQTGEAEKLEQKAEQVARIRQSIEAEGRKKKEEKKLSIENFKGNERQNIEAIFGAFVSSLRSIYSNMQDVASIAAVVDQTPEEKEILKLARQFQSLLSTKDLKPPTTSVNTFLSMIGEAGYEGYRRMGIIRDELVPLLNNIQKAYVDIGNVIQQKEKEEQGMSEELHALTRRLEKKETEEDKRKAQELMTNSEKFKDIKNRLEKIKSYETEFLKWKENYEEVHHQIVEWSNKLTGKMSKK